MITYTEPGTKTPNFPTSAAGVDKAITRRMPLTEKNPFAQALRALIDAGTGSPFLKIDSILFTEEQCSKKVFNDQTFAWQQYVISIPELDYEQRFKDMHTLLSEMSIAVRTTGEPVVTPEWDVVSKVDFTSLSTYIQQEMRKAMSVQTDQRILQGIWDTQLPPRRELPEVQVREDALMQVLGMTLADARRRVGKKGNLANGDPYVITEVAEGIVTIQMMHKGPEGPGIHIF